MCWNQLKARLMCLCLLLYWPTSHATLVLGEAADRIPMSRFVEVLEDPAGEASIDQIRAKTGWQQPERDAFNFGLSRSVWWLRLTVDNQTGKHLSYVLDLGTTQQDFVEWYIFDSNDGHLQASGEIGDLTDFRRRAVPTRKIAIPLNVEVDGVRDIYLRLSTSGVAFSIISLEAVNKEYFLNTEYKKDFLIGLFLGGWLFVAMTVFFLFFIIRWVPALFFGFFIISMMCFFAAFLAVDLKYFSPQSPFLHRTLTAWGAIMSYIAGALATAQLMKFKLYLSLFYQRIFWILVFLVFSSGYWVSVENFGLGEASAFLSGISLVGFVWWLLLTFVLRNLPYALPLFLIYSAMLSSLILYCLHLYNVIFLTRHVVDVLQLAALITLIIFGLFVVIEIRQQLSAIGFKKARLSMARYIAHDIRAPQSAILALLERAEEKEIPCQVKSAIEDQVKRTVALVESFLWLSKAESLLYSFEEIFLGEVVAEALDMAWPLIEHKSISVKRIGLDDEGGRILADRAMLTRCIFNLIENSVKYSSSNSGIVLSIEVREHNVALVVQDHGSGMRPDFINNAFAEFRRDRNDVTKNGFGLGLAFVASVLEQHHAKIVCHSALDKGSKFILIFNKSIK